MKSKILITGSNGYIGKNLQTYLRDKEYEVVCLDRRIGNDVMMITSGILKEVKISHIIHLAAVSGIKNCSDNLRQAYIDNIKSTIHLFKEASLAGVNVTFASSQAAKTPHANYYALSKYFGECEADFINKNSDINISVLRFTNIYGGMGFLETKNTVVSKFAKAKMNDETVTLNGDGDQIRDFVHISDVCNAIWRSTLFNCSEPVDIGTGVETTIRQLALHFKNKFTTDPRSGMIGTMRNVADTVAAEVNLGFRAEVNLKEQIEKEFLNV